MVTKPVTCENLLCVLCLPHIIKDTQTCRLLTKNGFTMVFALQGIHKKTLRNMGIKHGHANEIVNAVKAFSPKRPKSAQRRHSYPRMNTRVQSHPQRRPMTAVSVAKQLRSNVTKQWKPRVFLSYAWGEDTHNRDNQKRVLQLSDALRCTCKVETWIDTECMHGSLTQAMCNGIDSCDVILVCITRSYIEKCNKTENDNCKLELNYSYKRRGEQRLIPVVMEDDCVDPSSWDGPVGAYMNQHIYISCVDDVTMQSNVNTILKHIERTMTRGQPNIPFPTTHIDNATIVKHWNARVQTATGASSSVLQPAKETMQNTQT